MMHKAWSSIKDAPCWFLRSSIKGTENCWVWSELSVSGMELHFTFTDGFEMMHKALRSIESRCPIVFRGHPTNFKDGDLNPNLSKITRLAVAIKSFRFTLFRFGRIFFQRSWGLWPGKRQTPDIFLRAKKTSICTNVKQMFIELTGYRVSASWRLKSSKTLLFIHRLD